MGFPVPGGSVLVCCRDDDFVRDQSGALILDANGHKQLIPHGYVRQYDAYTQLIRQQLATMFQNGQRRLGIAVAFTTGGDGFALDASQGRLIGMDAPNLANLIGDIVAAGFAEIVIEIIPEWDYSYANWQDEAIMGQGQSRAFQPLKYADLLTFINDVWNTSVSAAQGKVAAWLDLFGECGSVEVGSRLWSDWCILHPDPNDPATALGFSMVPTQAVIDQIPQMYTNGIFPRVWNVHPYPFNPAEMTFGQFKAAMKAKGYGRGYIIGETNCNDPATAQNIVTDKGDLFWLLQWPVVYGQTPQGISQDRLTLEYSAYSGMGL